MKLLWFFDYINNWHCITECGLYCSLHSRENHIQSDRIAKVQFHSELKDIHKVWRNISLDCVPSADVSRWWRWREKETRNDKGRQSVGEKCEKHWNEMSFTDFKSTQNTTNSNEMSRWIMWPYKCTSVQKHNIFITFESKIERKLKLDFESVSNTYRARSGSDYV